MKNAATGIGLAVLGLGIAVNGLNLNGSNEANATTVSLDRGPGEPVIVAFGSLGGGTPNNFWSTGFYRLWSDGRTEVRLLSLVEIRYISCGSFPLQNNNCGGRADTGWIELPAPPGGDGFACRGDINGDRNVDSADLGLLIAQWGQDISCDPQPSYPCFDLNGLNMNIATR